MTSFKSKVFKFLIKNRPFLKGELRREVIDPYTSVEKCREEIHKVTETMSKLPGRVKIIPSEFEKFYSEWIIPENYDEEKAILYFHGGGFIAGKSKDYRRVVSNFSKNCGVKYLVFDYSLAPEKPFPSAIHDSLEIYSWLLETGYKPENIMFVGDSAGGGIEISTLLMLRNHDIQLPKAAVVMSPCVDMTCSGESNVTKRYVDPCMLIGPSEIYTSYYVGNHDPKDPIISPIFADFKGICPIMIQVGEDETLLDDSIRLAKKAEEAGVDTTIHIWKDMFHCFPMLSPMFPEASAAMEEICEFIKKYLK